MRQLWARMSSAHGMACPCALLVSGRVGEPGEQHTKRVKPGGSEAGSLQVACERLCGWSAPGDGIGKPGRCELAALRTVSVWGAMWLVLGSECGCVSSMAVSILGSLSDISCG